MKLLIPLFLITLFIIFSAIVFSLNQTRSSTIELSLPEYAEKVTLVCSSAPSRQRCYDGEILKLTDVISMEKAFEVTKIVQEKDPGYWFCHELAHNLSEKEYAKDPMNWKGVVTRCPVGMCSNGCIHGAIQRHFIAASLNNVQLQEVIPVAQTLCERRSNWNPTPLEQASCYHELGHLSLYLTDSDIPKSVAFCDQVAVRPDGRNYLQTCHEGIFMQIFEPREPEDFGLIYELIPIKERLAQCEQYTSGLEKGACWKKGWLGKEADFCNQFSGEIRNACFREAWVVDDKQIETAEGIIRYCSYSDDEIEKKKCYNKLYYSLMAKFEFAEEKVKKICTKLPQAMRGQCFANIASRMIETDKRLIDKALGVCQFAATFGVEKDCYQELSYYATFAFHAGTSDSLHLCENLPHPWNKKCLPQP